MLAQKIYQNIIVDPNYSFDNIKNIADLYFESENTNMAIRYYNKALKLCEEILENDKIKLVDILKSVAKVYDYKNEYNKSILNYNKALIIEISCLGEESEEVSITRINIGDLYMKLKKINLALDYYLSGITHYKTGGFLFRLGNCYLELNEHEKALEYYIQSAEMRKADVGIENEATQVAITNTKRLAKELNKESELPDWIKKIINDL